MSHRFDGRVAIVTGSGKGIGRATAMLLAAEDARVNDIGNEADGTSLADLVVAEIAAVGAAALASHDSVSAPRMPPCSMRGSARTPPPT